MSRLWFHDLAVVSCLVVFAFAGCNRPASESPAPAAGQPAPPPSEAIPSDVSLKVIDEKELAEAIQRHRGKVVLVDFWATWCMPCVEMFPHAVELHKKHAGQGLAVISVSFDFPEDDRQRVHEFLAAKRATFENYISRYGGDPKSFDAFSIENGGLPNIKLYDRSGTLRKTFGVTMPPKPFTPEDIDKAVEDLMREK